MYRYTFFYLINPSTANRGYDKKNSSDSVVSMIPQISTQRCQLPPRSLTQQCRDTAELDLAVSVAPRSLTALTSQSRYNFLVFV